MTWWRRFLSWFRPAPVRYPSQVGPVEPFDATALAAMHNIERAKEGVGPLLLDTRLTVYAVARASRAAALHLALDHLHDGFTPNPGPAGENAAMGHADSTSVMAGWMGSKKHRANILNLEFSRMGAARAMSADGVAYWYVVFSG